MMRQDQVARASLLALLLAACVTSSGRSEQETRDRLAKAEAMFQERCKTAGEKIYRTADNVEGIFLMKIRPDGTNYGNQYQMDDPYGHDSTGIEYVKSFLYGRNSGGYLSKTGPLISAGYRYVEAIDLVDGQRYRYTGALKPVGKKDANAPNIQSELQRNSKFDLNNYAFLLDKVLAPGEPPRYGVTYDDISTREDREYWIAGSSLKVIDLKANETIAERIGYMMDRGQGNNSGGRSPWLLAANHACPSFRPDAKNSGVPGFSFQVGQTRNFVEKVLKPEE